MFKDRLLVYEMSKFVFNIALVTVLADSTQLDACLTLLTFFFLLHRVKPQR